MSDLAIGIAYTVIISAIFLVIGIYINRWMTRPPKCRWFVSTHPLDTVPGSGSGPVYKSMIVCWNSGSTALKQSNMATSDPLRASIDPACMINASVVRSTRPPGEISLETNTDHNFIEINFDFLNRDDGFIIEIYHRDAIVPSLDGSFADAEHIERVELKPWRTKSRVRYEWGGVAIAWAAVTLITAIPTFLAFDVSPTSVWFWLPFLAGVTVAAIPTRAIFQDYLPAVPDKLNPWKE